MPKLLTIEDLRESSLQSGFRYVTGGSTSSKPWRATGGSHHAGGAPHWHGPWRATEEEAALDYCKHANSGVVAPSPVLTKVNKNSRPESKRRVVSDREKRLRAELRNELRRNPPERMHDPVCYLVGMKGDTSAVKVGYADYNVYSRVDSLQTGNPRELVLLGMVPGGLEAEKRLHAKYIKDNILQEWFTPTFSLLSEFGLTWLDYLRKVTT